jgi:hypothetical protein
MRDGGKGNRRRNLVVTEEIFNSNWNSIFGKREKKMFENAIDKRTTELMQEIKELIGKK